MAQNRRMDGKKRDKITITIESDLLEFVDKTIVENHRFYNRSHFIELALSRMKEDLEKKG